MPTLQEAFARHRQTMEDIIAQAIKEFEFNTGSLVIGMEVGIVYHSNYEVIDKTMPPVIKIETNMDGAKIKD